jgi:hypothetical protein
MKSKAIGIFDVDETIASADEAWHALTDMLHSSRNWMPRYHEFIATDEHGIRSGARYTAITIYNNSRGDMWIENWNPERRSCTLAFSGLDKQPDEWLKFSVLQTKNHRLEVEVIVTQLGVLPRISKTAKYRLSHLFQNCPLPGGGRIL